MPPIGLFGAAGVLAVIVGCLTPPPSAAHDFAHVLIVATTLGLAAFLAAFAYQARRHQQLASGLARLARHDVLAGQRVEVVAGLSAPFVAGLWTPQIFCGDDLGRRLDPDELRAVVVHEQHHQRERAPLRLVAVSAVAPIVGRSHAGRAWIAREQARVEIAADAHALAEGTPRSTLASALLKLAAGPGLPSAPGFATAADLRIRTLLGEPTGLDPDRRRARVAPAVLVLAGCLVVYLT